MKSGFLDMTYFPPTVLTKIQLQNFLLLIIFL